MGLFHAFRHARHHHHHHGRHHAGHEHGSETSRLDHLADKISHRLDLSSEQQEHLLKLLANVDQQRQAIRGESVLQDLHGLLAGTTFDRAAAQQLLDARIAAVQAAGPTILEALAEFYDSLDTEQQQVLRFMLRLRQRFAGRHGHGRPAAQ
jgi:Spy/CpxP family protein refolding chaperone